MDRKTITFAAAVPLLFIAVAALQSTQTPAARRANAIPVAWVNTQVVLQSTPGYAQAESTFTREMAAYQAEIAQLQTRMDSAVTEYERTSLIMTPTARDEREQQLRQMQTANQQRVNTLSQQAQARERELVGPIEERVSAVIEGLRAERDIGIVFDVAAASGSIVAADRALDLTPTIIQRLGSQ